MLTFISYQLKVAVALIAFYLCFKCFLSLVRDEYSREHFGKSFEELDADGRAAVTREIPRSVCEITPKTSQRR